MITKRIIHLIAYLLVLHGKLHHKVTEIGGFSTEVQPRLSETTVIEC